MQETELLRTLRSVRRFSSRPLPESVLTDVLDVARWTGSAKNSQPWELLVVHDRDVLTRLAECGPFASHLAGASLAIVLLVKARGFDEGRLAQNVMLAAWAHGVGSCIASLYPDDNQKRAKEILGVPDDLVAHTAISLGYPADERALRLSAGDSPATIPLGRQPLSALVSWERYGRRER